MGKPVRAADIEFYVEQRGEGPDVLMIVGLGDTIEAWQFQLEGLSRWLMEVAPSEREFLEAFFLWIYTPRAHNDGTVGMIVEEALAFPHKQSTEAMQRSLDAFGGHDAFARLPDIAVPTLVLAGGRDICTPPRYGQIVAERIPGARFEVLPEEAHQPFQEMPDEFNSRALAFWREVEAQN